MRYCCRQIESRDVPAAVAYVKAEPLVEHCYGRGIEQLATAWSMLIARDCLSGLVVEDTQRRTFRALIAGAFVNDDFVNECKISPRFWLGPELTRRVAAGNGPVLSPAAVRQANSGEGLNYVVWACHRPRGNDSEDGDAIYQAITARFFLEHRGFQFKEILLHHNDLYGAKVALNAGARFWNFASQKYESGWDGRDREIERLLKRPCLLGVCRRLALENLGWQISPLFIWRKPRVGFTEGEQRLLRSAMIGLNDEALSEKLQISRSTVKNNWRSIFRRVAVQLPDLLPQAPGEQQEGSGARRGKEKRQRLIRYLCEHAEEVRPFEHRPLPSRPTRGG